METVALARAVGAHPRSGGAHDHLAARRSRPAGDPRRPARERLYLSWKVVAPLAGWAVRCGLELERQYIYGVQKGSAYTSYRLVYTSYRLVYTSYRLVFTCTLLEATAPAVER